METDEPNTQSKSAIERPYVPTPTPAKLKDYIPPSQGDQAGMREWKDEMLSGHPGCRATSFEQWGNSYVTQFKVVFDKIIQSLRIKEEAFSNMFSEWAKMVRETKGSSEKAQHQVDEATAYSNNYSFANSKLKTENNFLREKLKVSADKLNREVESNTNLFTTIKMAMETAFRDSLDSATNKEMKRFLSETNCMELLDTVDPKVETIYFLESLLKTVPLYGPEGTTFVKTDNPCTVAMQMHMYADSWDILNLEELREKQ